MSQWDEINRKYALSKGKPDKWRPEPAQRGPRPVVQYSLDGDWIADYESASQAARALSIAQSSISFCCMGKMRAAGGFKWKYKDEL